MSINCPDVRHKVVDLRYCTLQSEDLISSELKFFSTSLRFIVEENI